MSTEQPAVLTERRDNVLVITLNRPEARNAVNLPLAEGIAAGLDELDADDALSVGVLTGAGGFFCAGMDLKAFVTGERPWVGDRGFAGIVQRASRKPLIAAVEGFAVAGGFEIALACDLIVAAEHARFGLPEVTRGIVAGAGGMHRLPRQIPLKIAMGYMLTGKHMSADEAHQWGLVNEVVPADKLMETARRWADEICAAAPLSVRASKQSAYMGLETSLEEAYNTRYPAFQAMQGSEDSKEGPRAFAENSSSSVC